MWDLLWYIEWRENITENNNVESLSWGETFIPVLTFETRDGHLHSTAGTRRRLAIRFDQMSGERFSRCPGKEDFFHFGFGLRSLLHFFDQCLSRVTFLSDARIGVHLENIVRYQSITDRTMFVIVGGEGWNQRIRLRRASCSDRRTLFLDELIDSSLTNGGIGGTSGCEEEFNEYWSPLHTRWSAVPDTRFGRLGLSWYLALSSSSIEASLRRVFLSLFTFGSSSSSSSLLSASSLWARSYSTRSSSSPAFVS